MEELKDSLARKIYLICLFNNLGVKKLLLHGTTMTPQEMRE